MRHERLVIIGTGPAGYTAAIYAARANLQPLMIEGGQPGGQLTQTTEVENWPGYPDGIMGPDMMLLLRKQAERFGARIETGTVKTTRLLEQKKILVLEKEEISCDAVIIATGATAKWLGLPSEEAYQGRGVSACATCDGFFFRGKKVAIVGGGDAAMEEAMVLAKFAETVTVLVRSSELRASRIMQERALQHPKLTFLWNTEVQEVLGDEQKMTGLRLLNRVDHSSNTLPFDGLFIAIGHTPNVAPFPELETTPLGYISVEGRTTKTSVAGVFAAGDVADHSYRQAITAAGTGCMAALDAERYLSHYS